MFCVHRLVLYAHGGPPPDEATWEVNHIDRNCSNNQDINLEWVTHSQNMLKFHASASQRNSKRQGRLVMVRHIGSQKWTRYASATLAAEKLGQPKSTVSGRCRRNACAEGFEYKYCDFGRLISEEVWHPMIDPRSGLRLNGQYVSSAGRIKSHTGRISTGICGKDGYVYTYVKVNGHWRRELVHRVVAATFLDPPSTSDHTQINHKDGNKSSNTVANLEYATPSENMLHHNANRKGCHPLSKAVLSRVYGSSGSWRYHSSLKSAADALGGRPTCSISKCINGKQRHTGGFEFRLAEPDGTAVETLPGEEWRDVDVAFHLKDRRSRKNR